MRNWLHRPATVGQCVSPVRAKGNSCRHLKNKNDVQRHPVDGSRFIFVDFAVNSFFFRAGIFSTACATMICPPRMQAGFNPQF